MHFNVSNALNLFFASISRSLFWVCTSWVWHVLRGVWFIVASVRLPIGLNVVLKCIRLSTNSSHTHCVVFLVGLHFLCQFLRRYETTIFDEFTRIFLPLLLHS